MFLYSVIHNMQQCANSYSAQQPIKFNKAQMKKVNKRIRNRQADNERKLKMEIQKR